MRFDCGETYDAQQIRLQSWQPFFVLWPRTIEETGGRKICAFLEYVERKGTYHPPGDGDWYYVINGGWTFWTWEFRWRQL